MNGRYVFASGILFGLIALAQLVRAVSQVPIHVGTIAIPVWVSWVAALVGGSMCVWAFASRKP